MVRRELGAVPDRVQFAALAAAVLVIGMVDIRSGPEVGMSLFYLGPIAVAGWRFGGWAAVFIAFLAAASWTYSDNLFGLTSLSVTVWNGFTRLVIYIAVAVLLDRLHRERGRLRATVARLDAERARQDALIAALSDAMILVDDSGRISGSNERAVELVGRTRLQGRTVEEVLPFVATEQPVAGRWTGALSDPFGERIDVEVTRASIGDAISSRAALYLIHDITQHAELNRMREQLLYSVAHELRGPLGVLENALDLLTTEYGDLSAEEYARLSGSALRTAQRLRLLMEDLLSAGNIQSGRFRITPEVVAVRALVDEAVDAVSDVMTEREQRLDIEVPADAIVRADHRYARQVLTNLLANASKYAAQRTAIVVRASQRDSMVRVSVEDSGPGIPRDEMAGLFERFYRMRRDAAEPGVGLGLAIAKGIVEAHGGQIGIDSELGKGTVVWFTLPAARPAVAAA